GCHLAAAKRDGRSGRLLWQRDLGSCRGPSAVIIIDANDDVLIGTDGFAIVKLASRTGDVLWRNLPGPDQKWSAGTVMDLAVDPAGDIVAAGDGVFNPGDDEDHDFVVVKVRGATGDRVWDFSIDGALPPCPPDDFCDDVFPFDYANQVAVDGSGRVF